MKFRWNLVTIVYFTVLVVKTKSQSKPFDFYLLFIYLSTFLEIRRNKKCKKGKKREGKEESDQKSIVLKVQSFKLQNLLKVVFLRQINTGSFI